MTKQLLSIAAIITAASAMGNDQIVLDLSQPTSVINYNENNVWSDLYTNTQIESQGFVFSHSAPYGEGYYEGFIASKNTDNQDHSFTDDGGWTANQWGCMAQGGADENGNAISGKPFLINYYSTYSTEPNGSSYITRNDNSTFTPEGCYICNHPWTYYGCVGFDGYAGPLAENGGFCKVTFHGINTSDQTEKTVDFYLADRQNFDANEDGIINEDDNFTISKWAWCDLSALGTVDVISLSMESSDSGTFGMNTAAYVCLDRLTVNTQAGLQAQRNSTDRAFANNGTLYLNLSEAQTITVYGINGSVAYTTYLGAGNHTISLQQLPAGVYAVRYNGGSLKIVK